MLQLVNQFACMSLGSPVSASSVHNLARRLPHVHPSERSSISVPRRHHLTYVPHNFDAETAKAHFIYSKRIFAPLTEHSKVYENTVKKVLLPFFGVQAFIVQAQYVAKYGFEEEVGKLKPRISGVTQWHSTSGSVGPFVYGPESNKMRIYAGFSWHADTIEEGVGNWHFLQHLVPCNPAQLDRDIVVDPFLRREAFAQSIAINRVFEFVKLQLIEHIKAQTNADKVEISSLYNVSWKSLTLRPFLLPAYIFQPPNCPPLIMPALNKDAITVRGQGPLSPTKVVILSNIATTILLHSLPAAPLPLFIHASAHAISTVLSYLLAKHSLSYFYHLQQQEIKEDREKNTAFIETAADLCLKHCFEKTHNVNTNLDLNINHLRQLGLASNEEVTAEKVKAAFLSQIKKAHPDHQSGSGAQAAAIIAARDSLLQALSKRQSLKK